MEEPCSNEPEQSLGMRVDICMFNTQPGQEEGHLLLHLENVFLPTDVPLLNFLGSKLSPASFY